MIGRPRTVVAMAMGLVLVSANSVALAQPPTSPGYQSDRAEYDAMASSAHPDPSVRAAATFSLARVGTPAAVERLWLMARVDIAPAVRIAAIEAAASSRSAALAPALLSLAETDPDPAVRQVARAQGDLLRAYGKSPGAAAGLSLLCAGCGHLYLGQSGRGGAYLGTFAALISAGWAIGSDDVQLFGSQEGPNTKPTVAPLALPLLTAAFNLSAYSAFDAYRRARLDRNDEGYRYPVSRETLGTLAAAPFRPRVLARPWFWAGLPAIFGGLIAYSLIGGGGDTAGGSRSLNDEGGVWFLGRNYGKRTGIALGEAYWASLFFPVGIGEESLFRGVVQPALTEWLGLWPGWAAASLIFGAVHITNFLGSNPSDAAWAVPFITAVGGYMGAVSIKTGFQLETSVALHFWYDFLLGTAAFIADPDHQPFAVKIGMPF